MSLLRCRQKFLGRFPEKGMSQGGPNLCWRAAGAAPEVQEVAPSPEAAVRPGIVSLLVCFIHQSLHKALLQCQRRLFQQPAQSFYACVAPTRLAFVHQLCRKGSGYTADEQFACNLPIRASGLALNGTQRLLLNRCSLLHCAGSPGPGARITGRSHSAGGSDASQCGPCGYTLC